MIESALPSGSFNARPSVDGLPFLSMITAQAAGDAIEVPDIVVVPPPIFSERILTPGAA